jgi:lysyl-tRNA synthetase class 2
LNSVSDDDLKKYAQAEYIKLEKNSGRGRVIDQIFKKKVRPSLVNPSFLINPPIEIEPLAKKDPKNPKEVQRMQIMAGGTELGKGFTELNDPLDQRERFEAQMKLREAGDKEAQMLDEDFVEALEYGMPPAAGFGLSERLFAVIMDKSIRETVFFPPMAEENKKEGKSKETLTVVAVINKGIKLETWQELNTIAHLTAAFGAREGRKLLYQDEIETKDEQKIKLNIQHAIMIKAGQSSTELQKLIDEAKKNDLHVSEFIREMIETTDDKKVISMTGKKSMDEIEYLGVLIFGKKSQVDELTNKFELYK